MYGTVTYLEPRPGEASVRWAIGEIDPAVSDDPTIWDIVVSTDGAAYYIPKTYVVSVEAIPGPVPGCPTCAKRGGPPHNASVRCESGRHNHCSCDICF